MKNFLPGQFVRKRVEGQVVERLLQVVFGGWALASVAGLIGCKEKALDAERAMSRDDDREEDAAATRGPQDAGGVDAGRCDESTSVRTARRARSGGYSGTEDDYFTLYEFSCEEVGDCVSVCQELGGSEEMCEASECLDDFAGGQTCLPAAVWRNLDSIQFEAMSPIDGVELTLVSGDYRDPLLTDDFRHEVPEGARVVGITVEVRRSGSDRAADNSIQLIKRGERVETERALSQLWTSELEWIVYGGPDDLWGETWRPQDVNADDFGVAIEVAYTQDAGNSRAYVDQVRTTIHYDVPCK